MACSAPYCVSQYIYSADTVYSVLIQENDVDNWVFGVGTTKMTNMMQADDSKSFERYFLCKEHAAPNPILEAANKRKAVSLQKHPTPMERKFFRSAYTRLTCTVCLKVFYRRTKSQSGDNSQDICYEICIDCKKIFSKKCCYHPDCGKKLANGESVYVFLIDPTNTDCFFVGCGSTSIMENIPTNYKSKFTLYFLCEAHSKFTNIREVVDESQADSGDIQSFSGRRTKVESDHHKRFQCNRCLSWFKNFDDTKLHLNACKQESNTAALHFCQICCEKFNEIASLESHCQLVHSDDKYYKCNNCHRIFGNIDFVTNHCEKHCESTKKTAKSEKGSISTVYYDYIFTCEVCYQCFDSVSNLCKHRELYHFHETTSPSAKLANTSAKEKKHEIFRTLAIKSAFLCQFCTLVFTTLQSYAKHIHRMHKDDIYSCILCMEKFPTNGDAKAHRESDHPFKIFIREKSKTNFDCACGKKFFNEEIFVRHEKEHFLTVSFY